MQAIIDKWGNEPKPNNYIFPILSDDDKELEVIHKNMKVISDALGFDKVSTYTARHSYATVLKRSGANIAYISETMGHSSLKTTEVYLASFESEERQKNAAITHSIRITNISQLTNISCFIIGFMKLKDSRLDIYKKALVL